MKIQHTLPFFPCSVEPVPYLELFGRDQLKKYIMRVVQKEVKNE